MRSQTTLLSFSRQFTRGSRHLRGRSCEDTPVILPSQPDGTGEVQKGDAEEGAAEEKEINMDVEGARKEGHRGRWGVQDFPHRAR